MPKRVENVSRLNGANTVTPILLRRKSWIIITYPTVAKNSKHFIFILSDVVFGR